MSTALCPRCGTTLRAPSLWESSWTCPAHGVVAPLRRPVRPSAGLAVQVAGRSSAPLRLPWPLPRGWVVTGLTTAGPDPRSAVAGLVALSGPNPLGGPADLLVVSEEPGVGLGAWCAGLPGPDVRLDDPGLPAAKVRVADHPVALWLAPTEDDAAAFVGEWEGRWLWLVLRPASAGALLVEDLELADLRDLGAEASLLPYGALLPWLDRPAPPST